MHAAAPDNGAACVLNLIKNLDPALYIVSTPIGNLKDISLRALEVLKDVNFIAAEDTRTTSVLLSHYDIRNPMISLNAVNESKRIPSIINKILDGESCALVSDAGTPGISDPGVRLISAAHHSDIKVVPVPGASALLTALTLSGLPSDSFLFEGFLPQKKGRTKKLIQLSTEDRTIIIFESTHRIKKLLLQLGEHMPERFLVVCRELTKKFEESWRGTPSEILDQFDKKINKGEFVVVISPLSWTQQKSV